MPVITNIACKAAKSPILTDSFIHNFLFLARKLAYGTLRNGTKWCFAKRDFAKWYFAKKKKRKVSKQIKSLLNKSVPDSSRICKLVSLVPENCECTQTPICYVRK